jgi:hypothetical protein
MLLISPTIDENIIKEDQHKLPKAWSQCGIHSFLECAWGTSEAKGHHSEFIMAKMSLKCIFEFLSGLDSDFVKPGPKV